MSFGDLILQNFFGIVASVIGAVFSYLALRFLRGIRASTQRTEVHAAETAERIGQLDTVSLTAHNRALEEWQRDMALRVEALAEGKSDTLAWQATFDRRLAAVEDFVRALDDYAHHRGDIPAYTAPAPILQEEPA